MTARAGGAAATEVDPGVHAVPASFEGVPLTVYAVEGRRLSLIDTGVAGTPGQCLEPALAELGAGRDDVEWVVNTHGHHDHVGGNAGVRERHPGVRVAAHGGDAGWVESPARYIAGMYRAAFPGVWEPPAAFEERLRRLCGAGAAVDVQLEDGDVVDLGGGRRLRVMWTPAHSPGHIVLYDEGAGIAFAGDAIQRRGTEIDGRPWLFPYYADLAAYRRSLELLRELPARLICTAHFGVLGRAELEALILDSEEMIEAIDELLLGLLHQRGSIGLGDVVAAIVERWPHYEPGLQAYGTPAAHLDRMVRDGEAVPSIDDGVKRWTLRVSAPDATGRQESDV